MSSPIQKFHRILALRDISLPELVKFFDEQPARARRGLRRGRGAAHGGRPSRCGWPVGNVVARKDAGVFQL